MKRIEVPTPKQEHATIRRMLEEVSSNTRSDRSWTPQPLEEVYNRLEGNRIREIDQRRLRAQNRRMLLEASLGSTENFVFSPDDKAEGDISYLIDTRFTALFNDDSLHWIDERGMHNRILHEAKDGNIAVIEFFKSRKMIDLRNLTEASKIQQMLLGRVEAIIDPPYRMLPQTSE